MLQVVLPAASGQYHRLASDRNGRAAPRSIRARNFPGENRQARPSVRCPHRRDRGLPRASRGDHGSALMGGGADGNGGADAKPRRTNGSTTAIPAELFQRVVRVVSFLFIVSVLFIETVTGAAHPGVYVLTAIAAFGIVLLQDLLPPGVLGKWRLRLEAGAAIAFHQRAGDDHRRYMSPYFFGTCCCWVPLLAVGVGTWPDDHRASDRSGLSGRDICLVRPRSGHAR